MSGVGLPAERIRVLWIIKGLGLGGAERLLASVARVRNRQEFDYSTAYLLPWKDALVGEIKAEGVPVDCLHGGGEWDLRWVARLRRRLIERPVDVVHAHSAYVASVVRLAVHTLPPKIRPVLMTTEHIEWQGLRRLTRLANSVTFRLDGAHVAVSDKVRESVGRRDRDRVETVVHGVPVEWIRRQGEYRDEMRVELGARPGDVLVGTVANFRAQKAYPVLLAAARIVADADATSRFVAVGQGPLEAEVRALHGKLNLGDRMMLLGGRHAAMRVMGACDVFVLASEYEGYPVAVMEALALGLPVVATAVGGVPEAVREGAEGMLVPQGRHDLLADRILRLARDPQLRARMGATASERSALFDIEPACRRIEAVYRDIAHARRPRAGRFAGA